MKEITTIADRYLFEHFYGNCSAESKCEKNCRGLVLDEGYSWLDVILDGERICGECEHRTEWQGFYYGKNKFSEGFGDKEYVTLNKIRTQAEFALVCAKINTQVKGIVIRGAVEDASPLECFGALEFVVFEGQRMARLWDMSKNPYLRMLTLWMNKNLKSLNGIENAANLECLQFYTLFSDVAVHKIESLAPISALGKLKELIVTATEPADHNIDYLVDLPSLEYLWISPNLFPTECYAKFEAKRFKLSEEYGIYCEDGGDIYPFGKGKRVMHTADQRQRYLNEYNAFIQKYKNEIV